jgi:kynurenine formamidase
MKIIDISRPIQHHTVNDPPVQVTEIQHISHQEGTDEMLAFFPGATKDDLPDGVGWAIDKVFLGTHSGTHLDAPYHYHPTMDGGKPAYTIDQVPLDWCIGPGVKLDFSSFPAGYLIHSWDIDAKLKEIGHELKPGDIVLVQSGAAKFWDTPEYLTKGVGFGREATNYLTSKGVHVTGTDAWSWDRPLGLIAEEYAKTKDPSIIWEGHFAGIDRGYCHIEKLGHLEELPNDGFTVIALPINIEKATAGWVRAVAVLDE